MSKVHADCVKKIVGDTIIFLYNSNENLAVFLIGRKSIQFDCYDFNKVKIV